MFEFLSSLSHWWFLLPLSCGTQMTFKETKGPSADKRLRRESHKCMSDPRTEDDVKIAAPETGGDDALL